MTEKKRILILECLKRFIVILFGYEINVYSNHRNMVYNFTLSKLQRVMLCKLILKDFGNGIQHTSRAVSIVFYTKIRMKYVTNNREETITIQSQRHANKLFVTRQDHNHDFFSYIYLQCRENKNGYNR